MTSNQLLSQRQVSRLFAVVALFILTGAVSAAPEPPQEIAAKVNGVMITTNQVDRDLARTFKDVKLAPKQQELAKQATLRKLIDQRIVFEFLKEHDIAAGEQDVHLQLEELKNELSTVEQTIDDYLERTNQTLNELQFQMAWQISWKRYLDRKLTDEFLESHFNNHKRQMDGTQLRVAHLLLKRPKNPQANDDDELLRKSEFIAKQITATSLTFEQAVAEHSEAPTRDSGGEIGWIKIDGPMPAAFTQAAFQLSAGEISPPVTTTFGVHLIKCLEVKEGKLGWRDTMDDVKKSASRAYFDAIAEKHREKVKIESP